jgi:hypothetical protein
MIQTVMAAIYARLQTTGLTIYDDPPQQAQMPYIVIESSTIADWSTDDTSGLDALIMVHAWSDYRGSRELLQMQATIYDALHRHPLTVPGMICLGVDLDFSTATTADGRSRHGVQRFRILLQYPLGD